MKPIIEIFGIGSAAQFVSMPPYHPPTLILCFHIIRLPSQFLQNHFSREAATATSNTCNPNLASPRAHI